MNACTFLSAYFVAPKISSEFLIIIFFLNSLAKIIAGRWLWKEKIVVFSLFLIRNLSKLIVVIKLKYSLLLFFIFDPLIVNFFELIKSLYDALDEKREISIFFFNK